MISDLSRVSDAAGQKLAGLSQAMENLQDRLFPNPAIPGGTGVRHG